MRIDPKNPSRLLDDDVGSRQAHGQLVRMRLAPGMGRQLSSGGKAFTAGADGIVEVPEAYVDALQSHGLTLVANP